MTTYKFKNSNTGIAGKILLFPNNDFSFEYTSGLVTQESKGKWAKKDDKVILQSDYLYKTGYIETKLEEFTAKDSMKVRVLFEGTDVEVPLVGITINNEYSGITNENGIAKFKKINTNEITIDYLGEKYHQNISKQNRGDLIIFLNEKDLSKEYFDKSEWIKEGRNLLSPNGLKYKLSEN